MFAGLSTKGNNKTLTANELLRSPQPELNIESRQPFSLKGWLTTRDHKEDFVLVELGHEADPVAAKQDFVGRRLYIGVEAWYSSSMLPEIEIEAREKIKSLRQQKYTQNIVFIHNPTGRTGYEGETYEPETVLPDALADEVFLGNVFGDPKIASHSGRTETLLYEAGRLISNTGKIVIRETYTPDYADVEDHIEALGLAVDARITAMDDPEGWSQLEALYAPLPSPEAIEDRELNPKSFYLVLSKLSA